MRPLKGLLYLSFFNTLMPSEYIIFSLAFFLCFGLFTQENASTGFDTNYLENSPIEQTMGLAANNMYVGNNGDFIAAGFTGAGTEGDPYVLDGAVMSVANGDRGILITGTTSHFIIKNCIITGTTGAILSIALVSAANGTIEN